METYTLKVGIIGGTGLDDPDIIQNRKETVVDTPYGKPSDVLIEGLIESVPCALLARHGRKHSIMPTQVNFRANIWALWSVGCTHVLVSCACGSLREEIAPGDLVIMDQFVDRTTKRHSTFYDGTHLEGVCHIPMDTPFCPKMREVLQESCEELGYRTHKKGTIVAVEGPRFSTRAESHIFRQWGCDIIGMTTCPEVVLAKERGLAYAAVGLATDYDCWRESEEAVSVEVVTKTLRGNADKALNVFKLAIKKMAAMDWTLVLDEHKTLARNSVM